MERTKCCSKKKTESVYSACSMRAHQLLSVSAHHITLKRSVQFEEQAISHDIGDILRFKFNLDNTYFKYFLFLNSNFFPALLRYNR